MSFDFSGSIVRTEKDSNDQIRFCATDVAEAIEHSKSSKMLEMLEKDDVTLVPTIDALGRQQQVNFISESGLYTILFRSDLPKCKPFLKWLSSEVLPSIRKTGSYSFDGMMNTTLPRIPALIAEAKAFGLSQNQASLAADYAVKKLTNGAIKPLELLGIEIKEDTKDRLLTPTELAQELNNPTYSSAKSVNILLAANGYQVKLESKQWQATEKGKQFCEVISVNKAHNSGAPVTQLKWKFSIVEKLKMFIEESSALDF
jgi:prophage antirepressor-like protein